jgi:hypothetical protein
VQAIEVIPYIGARGIGGEGLDIIACIGAGGERFAGGWGWSWEPSGAARWLAVLGYEAAREPSGAVRSAAALEQERESSGAAAVRDPSESAREPCVR